LNESKTYIAEVVEICENGDAILQFSDEMVKDLGWQPGDTVNISMEDGVVILENLTRPLVGE
jgi:formylmethanofuran dehydrogenase subunit D